MKVLKKISLIVLSALCWLSCSWADDAQATTQLREVTQQYKQTVEQRKRLVQQLCGMIDAAQHYGNALHTQLISLVDELAAIEHKKGKKSHAIKKVCLILKELSGSPLFAAGSDVTNTLTQIETLLRQEEQLLSQIQQLRGSNSFCVFFTYSLR